MIVNDTGSHTTFSIPSVQQSVVSSNESIFNKSDIYKIVEWTVVGTIAGILLNQLLTALRLKK